MNEYAKREIVMRQAMDTVLTSVTSNSQEYLDELISEINEKVKQSTSSSEKGAEMELLAKELKRVYNKLKDQQTKVIKEKKREGFLTQSRDKSCEISNNIKNPKLMNLEELLKLV